MSSVSTLGSFKYRRDLSLFSLVMVNMGTTIGSGWLFATLYSAQYAGPMGAIIAWIFGSVLLLFIALSFAEVSPMFPVSGGSTIIGELSHGKMTSFITGWTAWLADVLTPPIEGVAAVTYASFYFKGLVNSSGVVTPLGYLIAAILMIFMFIIPTRRVKHFGTINNGLTIWKIAIPALAIVTILSLTFKPTNFVAFGPFSTTGYDGIFKALILGGIVFSFTGFRSTVNTAGEAKRPDYIWKAILIGFAGIAAIYILLQVTFISGINWNYLGITPGAWSHLGDSTGLLGPFAQEAAALGLGWLVIILLVDAVVSPTGAGLDDAVLASRIFQSMSSTGFLPKFLSKLSKRGVPINTLIVGILVGFAFLYNFPSWSRMVGILSSTLVIAYMMAPAALNVFRRTAPDLKRTFRLPAAKILAPIGFIAAFYLDYWSGWPLSWEVSAVVLVPTAVIYFYYHFRDKYNMSHITSGIWLFVALIIIPIEAYLGPTDFGGINLIVFPWDFISVGITAVLIYIWAQYSGRKTEALEAFRKGEYHKESFTE